MTHNLKWQGATGGGTLGQRGLIFFFRWWNLRLGYAVMSVVVPFYMIFARKNYLTVYHYFRQQFCFPEWKSFCKTCRNHFLFGQVVLDRFAVFAGRKNDFEIEITGNEYYEQLAGGEKGFIIVGSHVGNFEIAGYLLNAGKKRINALVYGGETQIVQQNRSKILMENNIRIVPVSTDMSHLFIANAALANGEIVSMHADRVFGSSKSVECRFMKGKADFPVGAFALAVNTNVEILAVFCLKESAKKYKIFVQPISRSHCEPEPQPAKSKKKIIENLVFSYAAELENIVKQYPEQWFNYYKFWKEKT
jgi:predicted LPLAT superfamily acyltransferase